MIHFLELTEVYLSPKSLETICEEFDSLTNASFQSHTYQTFGKRINTDPPTFLLMNKWYLSSRPLYPGINTTKMIVTLQKNELNTQLTVTTKTNPFFIVFFVATIIAFTFLLLVPAPNFTPNALLSITIFIVLSFAIDRFLKQQLFVSLENDMKLKRNKQ